MIFGKVQVQFLNRTHNLEFRIRILQKISDPCVSGSGSGSTTLAFCKPIALNSSWVESKTSASGGWIYSCQSAHKQELPLIKVPHIAHIVAIKLNVVYTK
jgi:hypothetical protein